MALGKNALLRQGPQLFYRRFFISSKVDLIGPLAIIALPARDCSKKALGYVRYCKLSQVDLSGAQFVELNSAPQMSQRTLK